MGSSIRWDNRSPDSGRTVRQPAFVIRHPVTEARRSRLKPGKQTRAELSGREASWLSGFPRRPCGSHHQAFHRAEAFPGRILRRADFSERPGSPFFRYQGRTGSFSVANFEYWAKSVSSSPVLTKIIRRFSVRKRKERVA